MHAGVPSRTALACLPRAAWQCVQVRVG